MNYARGSPPGIINPASATNETPLFSGGFNLVGVSIWRERIREGGRGNGGFPVKEGNNSNEVRIVSENRGFPRRFSLRNKRNPTV